MHEDRLSRKLTDLLMLRDELQQLGVEIHIAKAGRVVGDSAETRALDNVEAIFAEMEREKILERTARGRQGKIASGAYLGNGHPPFGYRVEGEGRTTQLVIDGSEQKLFVPSSISSPTGMTRADLPQRIARHLRSQGIPTPADLRKGFKKTKKRAYAEWDAHSIYPLLRNSVYVGRFTNGRFVKTDGKRHRNPQGTTTIAVPAIVDKPHGRRSNSVWIEVLLSHRDATSMVSGGAAIEVRLWL